MFSNIKQDTHIHHSQQQNSVCQHVRKWKLHTYLKYHVHQLLGLVNCFLSAAECTNEIKVVLVVQMYITQDINTWNTNKINLICFWYYFVLILLHHIKRQTFPKLLTFSDTLDFIKCSIYIPIIIDEKGATHFSSTYSN